MTTAPSPVPSIIGTYRVERTLGEGGGGVVFEAVHMTLGTRVAIKLFRGANAKSGENVTRFLREARVAASLSSENVAQVTDVGTMESGEPFQVMELLVGRDLERELAARVKLPIAEAVDYVLQ